jgi:hypothetical protein
VITLMRTLSAEEKISARSTPEIADFITQVILESRQGRLKWRDERLTKEVTLNAMVCYFRALSQAERLKALGLGIEELDRHLREDDDEPPPPGRQVGRVVETVPERSTLTVRPVPEPPKRRPKARIKKKGGE